MIKIFIRNIIYKLINLIEKIEFRNHNFDEDNIFDKIINIINTNDYNYHTIETDYGFVPFSEINLTSPMSLYRLELENGNWLECADNHIVFTFNHNQKLVRDLTTDDYVLCKDDPINGIKVRKVKNMNSKVSMLDITVDTPEMSYYTNDILSHNTVSAAITILHYALFNKDKGIMIVANKGSTVVEIVDKIKNIYKLLPFFLKKGIENWNQSSIVFDNGCRIKTDKRTKEPAIGFTIDFLYIDEFAHIPHNIIEQYYTAVVPIISAIDEPRFVITSTPKGLNLFHRLLIGSELPEYDPNWNGFRSMRIYWWQLKGRRDTKIFLNEQILNKFKVRIRDIKKFLVDSGYEIYDKLENRRDGIFIKHKPEEDNTSIEHIRSLRYQELPLGEFGSITNWSEQQTKIIGGEDNFKQEYDLHFLSGGKMLFDSVSIEKMSEDQYEFGYLNIPVISQKLKFPYNGLSFVSNKPELFNLVDAKNYHIFVSVDLSEGLGDDYSIINIFRLLPKSKKDISYYKSKLTNTYDYFKLEQIGIYKSNIYSVKEIAHVLYMIAFELFDGDKTKIVLERNTYGDELLAHMPHVFDDNNTYSNHIFVRYKHRIEEKGTKMGIKITQNKKLLVKDFQSNAKKGNIVIRERYTMTEISTFTKHETPGGGITYKAESGHDDAIMSCIVLSSIFGMITYRDSVDELIELNGYDMIEILGDSIDEYQDEKANIGSIISGYSKIYNNKIINPNIFANKNVGLFGGNQNKQSFRRLPNQDKVLPFPNRDVNR